MTTKQQFFHDMIHFNAISFDVVDKTIGDLNKNIGLSAKFFTHAAEIDGSTISQNYDLGSILGDYASEIISDDTDVLKQSLQNVYTGIGSTQSHPSFNVSTHISTTISNYTSSLSSSFVSGQIYSFPSTGVGTSSIVSVSFSLFNLDGNFLNAHLFDVPIDFGVYGITSFNGTNYNNARLIRFDYSWSYSSQQNKLLVKLNYPSVSTNYYLSFYWGTYDINNISTNYNINGAYKYVGTGNFITNIGIFTTSVISVSITNVSGRRNFWNNSVPYNIDLIQRSSIESDPYLWAKDRINIILTDGIPGDSIPPIRYPVTNSFTFSGYLSSSQKYKTLFSYMYTSGLKYNSDANANILIDNIYSSNRYYQLSQNNVLNLYENYIPLNFLEFKKNPKKSNLGYSSGYSIINYSQIVPSAFVKVIEDTNLWKYFSKNIVAAKNYYQKLNNIITNNVDVVDNFIANFFFGTTISDVSDYFENESLIVSTKAVKEFTQPYGYHVIPPINFSKYEEKAYFVSANIVPSKEYVLFTEGKLNITNDFKLPFNKNFEIFKPLSYVCNGIDPYSQGTGLALDYTLNLTFEYENQNILNKTLYLMASKFLISKGDYEERVDLNQDIFGYFYLSDPFSTDFAQYSVSSINEFRLYGFSGLIPDLKDGTIRPILTKSFSPSDSTKYTYEQYVQFLISQGITNPDDIAAAVQSYLDDGNSFVTVNLNSHSNLFVNLKEIAICAANYTLNEPIYWNDILPNTDISELSKDHQAGGFTKLLSSIIFGYNIDNVDNPGTDWTITDVSVGINCKVDRIIVTSLGANQSPGEYTSWIHSSVSSTTLSEEPAQIKYRISSNGLLDTSSIEILNRGNFDFDFDVYLTDVGFSTGIGTTNAHLNIKVDNAAKFTAVVTSNTIVQFYQTQSPAYGYLTGFRLNQDCFRLLGFDSDATINIVIDNYPTVDSFFIAPKNLSAGDLEYYGTFETPQTTLLALNYSSGTETFTLFDREIFNTINVPRTYDSQKLSFISLTCKLIEFKEKQPTGYINANIYSYDETIKTKLASSEKIYINDLNREIFTTINMPIDYVFADFENARSGSKSYLISIENNIQGGVIDIKGHFLGIKTSYFGISSNNVNNDPSDIIIIGQSSVSAADYDLDLGITSVGISSVFGSNLIGLTTNFAKLYLRKNDIQETENSISLRVSTTYNSITDYIISNPISIASLATTFTGISFTFTSSLFSGTRINSSEVIFSKQIMSNKVFAARKFTQYNTSQAGFATTSILGVGATDVYFNFIFNKLFGQVNQDIFASFNNINKSPSGLPNPNTLREIDSINSVDGHWSFSSKKIDQPVSLYPRAFINNNSSIGTSYWQYSYMGYTHNMYVNIGYNSSDVYYQELIILNAYPRWKTTWMERNEFNYKNFDNFNILQQTYIDSIYYRVGLASTIIGITTGPKVAIFEGAFTPQGNLAAQVPVSVGIGTSCGVQVYINSGTVPIIDTFSVISSGSTTAVGYLTTEMRANTVQFKILYFTIATASIDVSWNIVGTNSLINSTNSGSVGIAPTAINSGYPIDELVFFNVSKTYEEAISINNGYPIGDSFVIRSS